VKHQWLASWDQLEPRSALPVTTGAPAVLRDLISTHFWRSAKHHLRVVPGSADVGFVYPLQHNCCVCIICIDSDAHWCRVDTLTIGAAAYLGRELRVYWPDDDAWYLGTAVAFDEATHRHKVGCAFRRAC